jgi:hypothetical protein
MAIAFSCSNLRAVSSARRFWACQGFHMHRAEQIDPHHLGNAAGVIAVGLVRLSLQEGLHVPRFDANHRQASSGQSLEEPLRQGPRFKTDPLKVPGRIFQNRDQVIRVAGDLHFTTSRQILPVSSTMHTDVSFTEMSSPALWLDHRPRSTISPKRSTFNLSTVHSHPKMRLKLNTPSLMRGLATAFPIVRPGLFLSYITAGVGRFAGHKASDGHSPAVVPPPPMREMKAIAAVYNLIACTSLATAHMKPASSRAIAVQTTVVLCSLAASAQHSIAGRQPGLRLPGDLPHLWWCLLQTVQLLRTDPRRMPIGPCALDQHVANAAVPRLGDAAPSPRLTVSPVDRSPGTRPR